MDYFAVVAGGGVVGLAIASRLARSNKNVIIIERHDKIGIETSSRNSEVIHAGLYYPKDSLKAKLCVDGNRMLYDWCNEYGISHNRIGKYVIAIGQDDIDELNNIYQKALNNGVENLTFTSREKLAEIEPNIIASDSFFSPDTGIIDSHGFMQSLSAVAQQNDADVALKHTFIACRKTTGGYASQILDPENKICTIESEIVINAAGLNSDVIAECAGIDINRMDYELSWCKGNYFRIASSKSSRISHLIYPVPEKLSPGLGIHVTKDLQGESKLGPNAEYLEDRFQNYKVDPALKEEFYISASRYIKGLKPEDIYPDQSGIRPKLEKKGEVFRDFLIRDEAEIGMPGFINLIGIESPGLTASLAIAEYVYASFIS